MPVPYLCRDRFPNGPFGERTLHFTSLPKNIKTKKPNHDPGCIDRKVLHAERAIRQKYLNKLDKKTISQREETRPQVRYPAQLRSMISITQKPGQNPKAKKMEGIVRQQYRKHLVGLLEPKKTIPRDHCPHQQQNGINIHKKKRFFNYTFRQCPNLNFLTWRLATLALCFAPYALSLNLHTLAFCPRPYTLRLTPR